MASKQLSNIKRRRQIRARFRGVIRVLMLNKALMSELVEDFFLGIGIKRKITLLVRRTKKTGPLTVEEKILFRKHAWTRTLEERKKLLKTVTGLRCFEVFPPITRAQIVSHLDYMEVNSGRTVQREGAQPIYVYFVLSGELVAKKLIFDTTKNEYINKQIYILLAGDCVGDIAFMENKRLRPYTIEVTIDAELLCLDGYIFMKYLYPHLVRRWQQIRLAISKYDYYFSNWDYMQISYVCRFGEIKEYAPMETIYHKDKGILNFVYFVISGECMILQNLRTNVSRNKNNEKVYELSSVKNIPLEHEIGNKKLTNFDIIKAIKEVPKVTSIELIENFSLQSVHSNEECHFIDVGTYRFGAIFGLGENLDDRAIMARTRVQCLLIPRFWLMEREQNPGNMWQTMAFHLDNWIPGRKELLTKFKQNQNWHEFKKDYVINEVLDKNNIGNPTKTDDIPLLCRLVETTYCDADNDDNKIKSTMNLN